MTKIENEKVRRDILILTKIDKKLSNGSLSSSRDFRQSDNSSPLSPPAVL